MLARNQLAGDAEYRRKYAALQPKHGYTYQCTTLAVARIRSGRCSDL
jgi:hypothetical protein